MYVNGMPLFSSQAIWPGFHMNVNQALVIMETIRLQTMDAKLKQAGYFREMLQACVVDGGGIMLLLRRLFVQRGGQQLTR